VALRSRCTPGGSELLAERGRAGAAAARVHQNDYIELSNSALRCRRTLGANRSSGSRSRARGSWSSVPLITARGAVQRQRACVVGGRWGGRGRV